MGNLQNMQTGGPHILGIALVICKNPQTGKYLAVNERNGTWWVPGGRVDAPEAFTTGAIRECVQQAGIDAELKGILRIEQSLGQDFARIKIVFYAQPKDPNQIPKKIADEESLGAEYYSIAQILELKSKWRGDQLYMWAKYLQAGGRIHPLSILQQFDQGI